MADETCRTYAVDGEAVVVRGDRPLDEQSQKALAEVVRAAKAHNARVNPHGGVIQELIAAVRLAVHCIPDGRIRTDFLGGRDGAEVKKRLKDAVAAIRAHLADVELADARDEHDRPKYARVTYDGGMPLPQVDADEYYADIDDEPELPEWCADCRASEDDCNCPDGYKPVRVI